MPAITDINELPKLKYAGHYLQPLQNGYGLDGPYGAQISAMPGGQPRIRRDTINNSQIVDVTYELTDDGMVDWFQMWWKIKTLEGSLPFRCMLSLGESNPAEYVAIALSAPSYTEMKGYYSLVSFKISAQKIVDDYIYWDFVLEASDQVDLGLWVKRLEKLVLVDMTNTLGSLQ